MGDPLDITVDTSSKPTMCWALGLAARLPLCRVLFPTHLAVYGSGEAHKTPPKIQDPALLRGPISSDSSQGGETLECSCLQLGLGAPEMLGWASGNVAAFDSPTLP